MDLSIQIKAIRMEWSVCVLWGHRSVFPNYGVFLSLRIVFTLTNTVDPDEMQHFAAFHLVLHFL